MTEPNPTMPSSYMRRTRPQLFSDSVPEPDIELSRDVLSYHLESLTSQKQEAAFEGFAHRLCEKFITPHLRPQTGPTGGGDGKTDAESYPVSTEAGLRWFAPESPREGERFAFAFSAKKDWRSKVNADVKSIAGTGRDYDHIYFVTNQFVPAKDSAAVQDALLKKHGIAVTILDRTWLLDRVFVHDSRDIAARTLGVGIAREAKRVGPKDYMRQQQLDRLEKQIRDASSYDGQPHALAEDALEVAKLARSLERPGFEVHGLFDRAVRIARDRKLRKHELFATYNWAWASCFWLDDLLRANTLYAEVERLALDSEDADDLERLSNLLPLLNAGVRIGQIMPDSADLAGRSERLKAALERISCNSGRPNNELHAKAMLLLGQVADRAFADPPDDLTEVWNELLSVIAQADGLGTFPFMSIANTLTALGGFLPESPEFDSLYTALTDALVKRTTEGEAAQKNAQRARQKLDKGLPYEAIRWFGRAVHLLLKDEYEEELVDTLLGLSSAYEEAGLPWAARNLAVAAVSGQMQSFHRDASIANINPAILGRFFWCELKLGRLPYILAAHDLEMTIRHGQASTESRKQRLREVTLNNGGLLSALLLATPDDHLADARKLPDALQRLALPFARVAVLYRLGYEAELRAQGDIPEGVTAEDAAQMFRNFRDKGVELELPATPDYCSAPRVRMTSRVLGCSVTVDAANNLTSIGIAESLLGALEALLATSLDMSVMPTLDRLVVRVDPREAIEVPTQHNFIDEGGETVGLVTHAEPLLFRTRDDHEAYTGWLQQCVLEVMLKFARPLDPEHWGSVVLGEESAFSRALTFANLPVLLGNIFGSRSRLSLEDWERVDDRKYPVRSVAGLQSSPPSLAASAAALMPEEHTADTFEPASMRHSDIAVASPIDAAKWDDARWIAAVFIFVPGRNNVMPVLGLAFENDTPARAIFHGWHKRFGEQDLENNVTITIVKGISAANPLAYGVVVGPNVELVAKKSKGHLYFISRVQQMYPHSHESLDGFLRAFNAVGRFALVPFHLPDRSGSPIPLSGAALQKAHLTVKNAWEISDTDLAISVLDLDDPPVIPEGENQVPVHRALEMLRRLRTKGHG